MVKKSFYTRMLLLMLATSISHNFRANEYQEWLKNNKCLCLVGSVATIMGLTWCVKKYNEYRKELNKSDAERAQDIAAEYDQAKYRFEEYISFLKHSANAHENDKAKAHKYDQNSAKKRIVTRALRDYLSWRYPLRGFVSDLANAIANLQNRINWLSIRYHTLHNGDILDNDLKNLRDDLIEVQEIMLTSKTYRRECEDKRKADNKEDRIRIREQEKRLRSLNKQTFAQNNSMNTNFIQKI